MQFYIFLSDLKRPVQKKNRLIKLIYDFFENISIKAEGFKQNTVRFQYRSVVCFFYGIKPIDFCM